MIGYSSLDVVGGNEAIVDLRLDLA